MPVLSLKLAASTKAEIQQALTFLQKWNEMRMRTRPIPSVLSGGVVYRREPLGQEEWLTAEQVRAQGYGDCEDLASYHAAWLTVHGTPARAIVEESPVGYHCLVVDSSGRRIDPSRMLGM